MFSPLVGQQAGNAHHRAFGRGIRRHTDPALERQHRGDVNDLPAAALGDKVLRRRLGHEKYALDVEVHHVVPVLFAERQRVLAADQAGIVDQNINMAKLRHRPLQQLRDPVDLAQVGGQAEKAASQRRHPLDGFHRLDNIDTDNIAARFRQPEGHPLT